MNTTTIYNSSASQKAILALYDKLLAQYPHPCSHLQIPTRYGQTFVLASGDTSNCPLVLLHGSGSNSATSLEDMANYSQQFRVYAVDIPGEPGKSDPQRFSWQGDAFAQWLQDVLDGLKLEKVVLIGSSLGGWAAIKYALFQPYRIKKLVVIAPSGIYPPRPSFLVRLLFFSLLGKWGRNQIRQAIFQGVTLSEDWEQFLSLVGKHFNYRMGDPPLFTDEELQNLKMPLLFLAGNKDVLLNTPKTAARLKKLLPNVTTKIFTDAGHVIIHTSQLIADWLNEC